MPSALDIIKAALEERNVIPEGATPSPSQQTYCLTKLNRRFGQLSLVGRNVPYTHAQAFTIATSQQSYTVGPSGGGANFVLSGSLQRPPQLKAVKLVRVADNPDTEVDLPVINSREYAALSVPAESADEPRRIYYQPTVPNGTLWPVPFPTNTANQLKLFFPAQLTEVLIGSIGNNIDLGLGYFDALVLDLAAAIGGHYGNEPDSTLIRDRDHAWDNITTLNTEVGLLRATDYVGPNRSCR